MSSKLSVTFQTRIGQLYNVNNESTPNFENCVTEFISYGFEFKKDKSQYWFGFYLDQRNSETLEHTSPIILFTHEYQFDPDFKYISGENFEGYSCDIFNYDSPKALIKELELKLKLSNTKNELSQIVQNRDEKLNLDEIRLLENKIEFIVLVKLIDLIYNVGVYAKTYKILNNCTDPDFEYKEKLYLSFGFYFTLDGITFWVGYCAEKVVECGCPLVLQKFVSDDKSLYYPITNYGTRNNILTEINEIITTKLN